MKTLLLKLEKNCILLIILLVSSFGYAQILQRGTATTNTSATASLVINKPTGIAVNDLMIVTLAQGNNNTTAPTCAGWTLIDGNKLTSSGTRYGAVLYKVATATDALVTTTSYTFAMGSGTNSASGAIITFSGVDSSSPFDVANTTLNIPGGSTTTATAISKTTVSANTAIIMLAVSAGNDPSWSSWQTATSPGSLTELFDVPNASGTQTSVGGAWATKAATGTSGNGTVTLSVGERNGAILLALRPCATNTITLSSAAGTDSQTKCINTAITSITYNTTGADSTTATSGLPTGVTGSWASNVYTISGTPTVSGTFNYTITLGGGCSNAIVTKTGTITVNVNTVGAASSTPSLCINTPLTAITHTTTGATGIGVATGLPAGVTAAWASNTITISGTPTASGTFNYSIPLTGGCGSVNATGTITVNGLPSITLGTQPSVCTGTTSTSFTYSGVTNGANQYSIDWTPAGNAAGLTDVNLATLSGGVISFTGVPATTGTYPMAITVRNSSTTCTNTVAFTTTVCDTDVEGGTVSLSTTNGTFATVDFASYGTPNGTCGSFTTSACNASTSLAVVSAAAIGQTSFSVLASNGTFGDPCSGTAKSLYVQATSSTFNLVVKPTNTITLSSGAGTNNQTRCINTLMTNITFSTTTATGATFSGLPSGVTGAWASNVVTLSGTPNAAGTFNYTVTLTGGCGTVTATGTITVNINTVGAASYSPLWCVNTALTPITHTTTSATGIGAATGLPAGVTAAWASNTITISGAPSASGTFNYSIPLTGGCGSVNATGTITVLGNNSITLSSGIGTNNQTRCINTLMTNITFNTTSAAGATFSGLPSGVTGAWASNVVTISGTPNVSGTFNYTVTLTGGCGPTATATGTITVNVNTATLTSGAGTNSQSLCINTPISNITYNTTGATGATFSGLPGGTGGIWLLGVITIGGSPNTAGTFNYTITLTGGCPVTVTGSITVIPNNTITISSGAGTQNQTKCINTALSNITFNTVSATGATFSGLPAGVTGAWAANVVTISGTPTVSGSFPYTVTLTGGCTPLPLIPVTTSGTITVTADNTITLTTAGADIQTKCISTGITTIKYNTTGATGATFSGLPAGLTSGWASNVVTISGSPSVSGTFPYTVTLTGGCGTVTATGTITVTPNNTITLSSGVGTNVQTKCINTAISDVTYTTTTATGATFSGLPAGVTGSWVANVVTITGTPTASGTFGYTVTLTGGCGTTTATGTITVTPNNTISLTSGSNNQTFCITTALGTIKYGTTGATGATFSGFPAGLTTTWASNVVTISGTPTVSGVFPYTVTLTGGCGTITATGTITINPTLTAGVTIAASPSGTICAGTSVTFTATPTNGGTTPTYQWKINGSNVVGQAAATFTTTTLVNTDIVTVVMTSNATPCLAGSPVTSSGITMTVSTMPTVLTTTPAFRTGPGTLTLGATASLGTISWYANSTGGSALGTGTSFTTPTISVTTTYYVEVVNGACTTSPRTAVTATINYPEIDIQGNATSIVSGDVTPSTSDWTDFTTVAATRTFTIKNTGGALLTIGTITISGTNASEFTVTTAPASNIAIGSSTTFVVTFLPTGIGARTASISIDNNDLDENPYTFDLLGTGVEQEIAIQGNASAINDGDTSTSLTNWTDFGNVAGTRTFTIYNTGSIALTIGTITIGGTNASDFTVTTPPASSVAANSSTTFVVSFSPGAINARTATISIANNDNNENPYDFAVSGYGIIPEIDIQGNGSSIADNLVPAPTTTNWTDFGSTAGTRTFTIYNNGNIALTVGAITFSGTNASEFTVTTPPAASVAAFSSTTFVVTFLPLSVGLKTANISIVNNDSNENPYDFRIQGTGTPREIDVQGLGLSIVNNDFVSSVSDGTDFGSVDVNLATVTRTFSVMNTGSLALTISNPTITGTNAADFSISSNPGTLTIVAGASTTFQVTFNPSAVFTRSAKINIVNNDSDENPYIFGIEGKGLLDNDGDGIENNADQDDDNDGIIDTIECGTCVSDPFVNGSFETPVIGAATYSIEPSANVTGWTNDAEPFIEIWSTGFSGVPAAAGNQFAELNANVAGNLYQTFCLNGAGGTINWAIKHRGRSGTDVAAVRFGATLGTVATVATMTDSNTSWGSYSGTYTIPVGQTTLVLAFTAISSTGGLSYGNFIDDVQIIINQNCIDSDGDGVADLLDVDDDNDGIPDIEEAGFKQYSNNTGTMDKTNPANWKDVNANGINDYIDSKITAGTYLIPDTDGDGVYNHLDLDSDNDSLWDVDEAGLTNGDGDINDDAKGDGADSEGDGLLNLFDNSTAFGSAYRTYAQDTDGNGISDYLQLDANDDGINDIQTSLYGSYDANGDGKIDGSADVDKDGIMDALDTNSALRGSPRDLNRKLYLDFDGRNDYAEDTAMLGGLANATLMAWVDMNSAYSTTGVVVGQDKFQIRMSSARKFETTVNGSTLSYNSALNKSQWYHVAATYGGGILNMYLNGKLVATKAITGPIAADATKLTLGRDPIVSTTPAATPYYFKGKIDEVRVFNAELTATQVSRMVHQEIQSNGTDIRGLIVPKDIGLNYSTLLKYYRMDAYKDDIVDNLTTASIDTGTGMKLYNHKVIAVQQAPMPFTTIRTGTLSTAVNDATKDIRGADVLDNDSTIIQVKHNITETANSTDLAMFIDPAITVSMTNNTKMQNDWYLKLDGKVDLVGRSQLVQTTNSDLDVTSAGSIERDQQGQSSKYNYNYWSSPVSSINNTTINHGYTVAGVMKDGTNVSNPQSFLWTTGVNGSPTTPITLSSYWIFKFQNASNSYANWSSVGPNGALLPGQGYTMKGCGSATADQNYTYIGKPNNGTITSTVGAGLLNLCGNPYPSALDANQFITDNLATTTGTLYIWQHYSTNPSHTTIQYQGGYATYTKTGGTAPVAPAGVSGLGSSSKKAYRFIPVGQGFFITGSATGGTITFNNAQRLFVRENDVDTDPLSPTYNQPLSYTMFKGANVTVSSDPETYNAHDGFVEEQFMKLRVGYNSSDNYHRETLLGFMNGNATSGFDKGYDAVSIESLSNDMYFINGTDKLNINGDGYFNVNNIYPLGVKNATSGNVTFVVDGKENFDDSQEIYIFDNVTNTYNSIKSQSYQVNLPAGTYDSRFSLMFKNSAALGTVDHEVTHGIEVTHSQSNNMINIKNALQEVTVKSVLLFNLLGQQVADWKIDNQNQADIHLPVSGLSTGTYIVKVITDGGDVSKKILIQK